MPNARAQDGPRNYKVHGLNPRCCLHPALSVLVQNENKTKQTRKQNGPSLNLFNHHSNPSTCGDVMSRPCKIWIRLTVEQADNYLADILKEEEARYKWSDHGLPDYIQVARKECYAKLEGELQNSDTIDAVLWEDMVEDTVATHREEAEYQWNVEKHACKCKDPWCPC